MDDMLAVEGQLDGTAEEAKSVAAAEGEGYAETATAHGTENFYSSTKKVGTWKKLKKAFKTSQKDHEGQIRPAEATGSYAYSNTVSADPTAYAASEADDATSELAPSELGRGGGSRMSMRYELAGRQEGEEGDRKGTLKGMFKTKNKKSKQIELDALRFEMGNLQEKMDLNQREVASYQHEVGILTTERDHLAHQVQDLTQALSSERAEKDRAEFERDRLKEQNSQVKSALQESYGKEQEVKRKARELEELAAAQQNSLEEAEERYRDMQQAHDQLHHAALAAKAQLVTAQAQLTEARTQREELLADLAALTSQTTALQSEIDSRDEKMGALEREAEQANSGLESALARLRELEAEQQQLEARVALLQEENLELSTELAGVTEMKRQVELQLAEAVSSNASLQAQLDRANVNVDTLTARLSELGQQLASSSEVGGSLRMQNTELLSDLANLREQHLARSKNGSPLSKWRIGNNAAKGAVNSSAAAAAAISTSANGAISAGGSSNGSLAPAEDRKGFSPMTSQLPAVRACPAVSGQTWSGDDDDVGVQVHSPSVLAAQADSSCLITAEQLGSLDAASAAAAVIAEEDTLIAAAGTLKPPVPSSSVELTIMQGPLMASRPYSRRPAGAANNAQQQGAADAAKSLGITAAGPKKKLFSGEDAAVANQQAAQQRQPDFFGRLFGCFAPAVDVQ